MLEYVHACTCYSSSVHRVRTPSTRLFTLVPCVQYSYVLGVRMARLGHTIFQFYAGGYALYIGNGKRGAKAYFCHILILKFNTMKY